MLGQSVSEAPECAHGFLILVGNATHASGEPYAAGKAYKLN